VANVIATESSSSGSTTAGTEGMVVEEEAEG
jgi:hypothetical protein